MLTRLFPHTIFRLWLGAAPALIVATLVSLPALAQEAEEAAAADDPAFTAEDVLYVEGSLPVVSTESSVATKVPLDLHQTPASIAVVTDTLFEDQGGTILGDALRNVPGVHVQTNTGVHDLFYIRGFESLTSGLVLTDGVSEPEATFYQLYNVDRVEVLRGPSAFLYGGNTLSGAASLVRKQPSPGDFLEVGVEGGSFATQRGYLDINRSTATSAGEPGLSFRLNAFVEDAENFRDDKDSRSLAVNPALTWDLGGDRSLALNLEVLENDYSPDAGLPLVNGAIPDVPRERSYQSPFDESEQEIVRARVDYTQPVGERWTLHEKLYFTSLDWQSRGTLLSEVLPAFLFGSPQVVRVLTSLDDRQDFYGNQLELTGSFGGQGGSGITHELVFGLELERREDDFSLDVAALPLIDVFNPVETATGLPPAIPFLGQRGDADADIIAPYVVDRIRLSDRFRLLLGARFDYIEYEEQVSGTSRNDSELSPLVGLLWSPSEETSVYLNAAQAFSPPSTLVTENRAPEESQQVEVGVKRQLLDGRLALSLAVYQLEKSNIGIPDATGITRQNGDQRSRGVEMDVVAVLAPGLRGFLSWAYNDAELTDFREIVGPSALDPRIQIVDRTGNRPAFTPRQVGSLWLSKRFPGGLGLSGGARYVSEQFIDEDNAFAIDGYLVLDAAVSYALGAWELRLNLHNLADEDYETRGFGAVSVIPGDPFAVSGGVRYRM